jgi:hypothetical protein
MRNKQVWHLTKKALAFFALLNLTYISFSQKIDSPRVASHFGGAVTVTNKGISTIPNLTLGKPAAIFDLSVVYRYLAGQLAPSYLPAKNISIGMYYLYSHGIEKEITRNTNLISVRSSFSNIRLSDQFYMRFNPQIYYLNMDGSDGFYFNSRLALAKKNFPLSVSSIINQSIQTNIEAGKNLLWKVSLTYSFNKEYVEN